MSQPETDDESRSRALEELKGKNIAHYSVLLTAFIQTKMEHDKTLVTLSAGGIGLLLTLLNLTGSGSTVSLVLFGGSFSGFLLTIGCALVIYERNASHIENELRGGAPKDFKLHLLDRSLKWSFMFAVLCAILAGTVSMWSTQMAASTKSTQDTKAFQRSL
jgi:hypothetical protein